MQENSEMAVLTEIKDGHSTVEVLPKMVFAAKSFMAGLQGRTLNKTLLDNRSPNRASSQQIYPYYNKMI